MNAAPSVARGAAVPSWPGARHRSHAGPERTEAWRFTVLANGYRLSGGLASGDEVLRLMRAQVSQPISELARWIVTHQVVSFAWHTCTLLPMFQFDRTTMTLRPGPRAATLELSGVFDDWELAEWWARPNSWLNDIAPVDRIAEDSSAVLQAARADRFIARG